MKFVTLNNGLQIPYLGFGTWKAPTSEITIEAVKNAIHCGHKLIDCASAYGNEKEVGMGIKESGIDRKELFIIGKLWNDIRGYDETIQAFENTCKNLQLDYLDMYMLHWPRPKKYHDNYIEKNRESWNAMEDLYKSGKIKSIAVSNFKPHHLEELLEYAAVKPALNQIEFHPSCLHNKTREYCRNNQIAIQGYSTLANGRVFECEEIQAIAAQLTISVAQLCTKYALDHNVIPLVKSVNKDRIADNLNLDFELDTETMRRLDAITTCGGSGLDSDTITF